MNDPSANAASAPPGAVARMLDSDVWHSFKGSPVAMLAALTAALCVFVALFAPWVAPFDPYDLAAIDLMDARLPPAWMEGGDARYWLGTDKQGRDLFAVLIVGTWLTAKVGLLAGFFGVVIGTVRSRPPLAHDPLMAMWSRRSA